METDTAISAREQLDLLRAELESRGWHADHRGTDERPFLHVRNPADAGLNGSFAFKDAAHKNGVYCWNYGPEIGPADDVQAVAARIMHVLRVIGP